jgi:hypothetical protein
LAIERILPRRYRPDFSNAAPLLPATDEPIFGPYARDAFGKKFALPSSENGPPGIVLLVVAYGVLALIARGWIAGVVGELKPLPAIERSFREHTEAPDSSGASLK